VTVGVLGDAPAVRLGDVLSLQQEATKVDPAAEYPNLGIYSFGRGLFAKPSIHGATTSGVPQFVGI
jgi:type I restriction enzyme S subunit